MYGPCSISNRDDLSLQIQLHVTQALHDAGIDVTVQTDFDNFIANIEKNPVIWDTIISNDAELQSYAPDRKKLIKELKDKGMWFVCADMGGTSMYDLNLTGPIGLVIGNEGEGVSRLVKEKCDFIASIPMKGDIDSLNASVAAGVLAYEIVRQRLN